MNSQNFKIKTTVVVLSSLLLLGLLGFGRVYAANTCQVLWSIRGSDGEFVTLERSPDIGDELVMTMDANNCVVESVPTEGLEFYPKELLILDISGLVSRIPFEETESVVGGRHYITSEPFFVTNGFSYNISLESDFNGNTISARTDTVNVALRCGEALNGRFLGRAQKIDRDQIHVNVAGCVPDATAESLNLEYSLDGEDFTELTTVDIAFNGTFGVNRLAVNRAGIGNARQIYLRATGDYSFAAITLLIEETEDVTTPPDEEVTPGGVPAGKEACLSIDNVEERGQCERCIEGRGTWTGIGCITTTPEGIFNSLIRIALGTMGGIALLRLIYLGYLYNFASEEKIKPAAQDILATLGGLLLVIFSVLILRVIGVNLLDVVPGGFF